MIYLDNSATTRVSPVAAQKAIQLMQDCYGNPSSLHKLGFLAQQEQALARDLLATAMGVGAKEVFFTSGGTEGNNLAILGAVKWKSRFGKHIVTSSIEHPSVLEAMQHLQQQGFAVTYLDPDRNGNICPQQVENAVQADTILVSLMSVNNETGALLPLAAVAPAIKRAGAQALFHVDHVQGFCKLPLSPKKLGVQVMTVSGHKLHAPKGVGALYVEKGVRLPPRAMGGGQEMGLRAGTENLPAIAAFGQAVQAPQQLEKVKVLSAALRQGILQISGAEINSPADASPYIVNCTPGRVRGETLLHFLSGQGIYVSTGSACNGGGLSHVLLAMGRTKQQVASALRISLCADTTMAEITAFLQALQQGLHTLKS